MKMTLKDMLKRNKELEDLSVLDLDSIIHKVTQEIGEVLEIIHEPGSYDTNHLLEEIGDAVLNVLSVQYRLDPEFKTINPATNVYTSPLGIAVDHGKRNDLVQKNRGIYARRTVPLSEVTAQTERLLGQLLGLTNQHIGKKTLKQLSAPILQKFEERSEAYGPHIDLKERIRNVPDYPDPNVQFKDISPLLANPRAFKYAIQEMCERLRHRKIDVIIALDARGFLFASPVAEKLGIPVAMVRKKGKLPWMTIEDRYTKEYEKDKVHVQTMHIDSIKKGRRVALIDDVAATGGSALSGVRLAEKLGGVIDICLFLMNLGYLAHEKDRQTLANNYHIESLVTYDKEKEE